MAPNVPVPQRDAWAASEETSSEAEVAVSPVPEVFLSHLPQHFQDPDSPNLHMLQRHDTSRSTLKPTARSQTTRSTLRAFRLPTGTSVNDQTAGVLRPTKVTTLDDLLRDEGRNTDTTHLHPQQTGAPAEESTKPSLTISLPPGGNPKIIDTLRPPPPVLPGDITTNNGDGQSYHAVRNDGEKVRVSTRRHEGRAIKTTKSPTSTTATSKKLDPGFLKLPGHEPEAPADLVLVHHDRAINTHNQTGLNGIFVKDETSDVTPEGELIILSLSLSLSFSLSLSYAFLFLPY